MLPLSDDFFSKWEHIIGNVEKTSVPLECIHRLVVKLTSRRQKTINVQTLRKQGLNSEEIETVINRTLSDFGDNIVTVNFFVDIESVADLVQPATDEILKKL